MAALTATKDTKRLPLGDRVVLTLSVADSGTAGATDAYVATGLSEIDAVLGVVVTGTTPAEISTFTGTVATGVNVVKNAKGTGVTAGTDPGYLGVQAPTASLALEITVLGRP